MTTARTLPSGAVRNIGSVTRRSGVSAPQRDLNTSTAPRRLRAPPPRRRISTSARFEHIDGGKDYDVAAQFGLEIEDVGWARSFELSHRRATRAA